MSRRLVKRSAWGLAAVLLAAAAGAYALVWAALPRRSGEAHVAGLTAPVAVELDAHAIPRIHGTSFEDALRGEGYLHAQERYFQMDLLRRSAAGELAALVGARAV
ncbi:MAG TPA: penicillin acylase family protein, partial [Gammaproteobacteria bacterium]|nr:penicillin acylase family protein [Gammaproteobacteria bacterium]